MLCELLICAGRSAGRIVYPVYILKMVRSTVCFCYFQISMPRWLHPLPSIRTLAIWFTLLLCSLEFVAIPFVVNCIAKVIVCDKPVLDVLRLFSSLIFRLGRFLIIKGKYIYIYMLYTLCRVAGLYIVLDYLGDDIHVVIVVAAYSFRSCCTYIFHNIQGFSSLSPDCGLHSYNQCRSFNTNAEPNTWTPRPEILSPVIGRPWALPTQTKHNTQSQNTGNDMRTPTP